MHYELVGIYTSSLYNPYEGKGELETIQFMFNSCLDEGDVEPDVLDYLMHRYIGVGDTTSLNSQYNPDYEPPEELSLEEVVLPQTSTAQEVDIQVTEP